MNSDVDIEKVAALGTAENKAGVLPTAAPLNGAEFSDSLPGQISLAVTFAPATGTHLLPGMKLARFSFDHPGHSAQQGFESKNIWS
jgi:hypothetical protein